VLQSCQGAKFWNFVLWSYKAIMVREHATYFSGSCPTLAFKMCFDYAGD
jgi:hypothetical protein